MVAAALEEKNMNTPRYPNESTAMTRFRVLFGVLAWAGMLMFFGLMIAACGAPLSTEAPEEPVTTVAPPATTVAPPTTTTSAPPTTTTTSAPTTTTTTTLPVGDGSREAPLPFGGAAEVIFDSWGDADGSVWEVTISTPEDISDRVEDSFNDLPAESVFAGFQVSMTLLEAGKEPLSTGWNFDWELIGTVTNSVHDDWCYLEFDQFDESDEVFVGGTLSGTVCIPLPVEDLMSGETQVAMNFSDGDRVYFGGVIWQ